MTTENAVLMQRARETLKGKWGLAIGAFLVSMVVSSSLQMIPRIGTIAGILVGAPMALGYILLSLSLVRGQDTKLEMLFDGFKNFGTALAAYLLTTLFTLLWSLLLIVPGIIAAISYSMTFFIIADDPVIGPLEAIKKSKAMMDGYKLKYFLLVLRFIGWGLLCILTLGIGFLWLAPYICISITHFYEVIKANPMAPESK